MFWNKKIDFLGIGDIVTDAFIELEDAWIETDNPQGSKELCMRFGDKIPFRKVDVIPAVGNSINAAVSAHRLGLSSGVVTNMGNDGFGEEMLSALKKRGINTKYVRVHKGMLSNYHYVLRFKEERTILVKHQEYPYSLPKINPAPSWIYLSSLAPNSLDFHNEIANFLEKNPKTKLAFQPGTFQMKLGREKLQRLYRLTEIFFCNKEEAQKILGNSTEDFKVLLKKIGALGPKITVITDGPRGSYALDSRSGQIWSCPMYPDPKPPVDRTGAGDSFASTFTVAIILGKKINEALMWGPINSMSVVQEIGSQKGLLTREQLEKYLREAPADYKPTRLE